MKNKENLKGGSKTLSDLTQEIVNNRKQSRIDFALQEKELLKMRNVIEIILQNKSSVLWQNIISTSNITDNWNNIVQKAEKFFDRLQKFLLDTGLFYLAKDRADRDYVNVGSVGITQEGKSEFNASIARLDKGILPRGGGNESCTTARINIINGVSPEGNRDIVRVHYYTVSEFANLIHSFLIELGVNKDEYRELLSIKTKEELKSWINKHKTSIENSHKIGKNEDGGKKIALLEYFNNLNDYIDRLDKQYDDYTFQELTSGRAEDREKAENYYSSVSYFMNPDDKTKRYFSYATKKAEVFTLFKIGNADPVSNLQFLDTPGIGENKPGLERILAKSVSSDLDIIMAIRAARSDVQSDATRQLLITQLRTLLNKRPKSHNSLYFIQNLWDNAEDGTGETEKNKINELLQIPQNLDKIPLNDSHFRTINILKNVEIRSDGSTNSNYPIHTYLFDILQQLIPRIKEIDEEYFADAKSEYNYIKKDFNEIENLILEISHQLPSEDLQEQVDKLFTVVLDKWEEVCSNIDYETLTEDIKYDLQTFCNQKTGIVLCTILKIKEDGIDNFDEDVDIDRNREFIDKFCVNNATAINRFIAYPTWCAGYEFRSYSEFKSALLNAIEETILSRIDVDEAQKKLVSVKRTIANVFRITGNLSFVSEVDLWWQSMAELLEKEKFPEELISLFAKIASFEIDYRKILGTSIKKIINQCLHRDNFGKPDIYHFTSHDSAKMSMIHSLLCIESYAQQKVDEEACKGELEKSVTMINQYIHNFRELISYVDDKKKTDLRDYWERFYKKHAREIFIDDEKEQKQALISDWNKLCEN